VYARVLSRGGSEERHDALLRAAIEAGGGREVNTEGDSFFAVFRTPGGALRAAATAQRSLAAEPWPEGSAPRVRMRQDDAG
jgi:class 3 adenylate cyclase